MRALGIDCGSEHTGYGVVDRAANGGLSQVAAGVISSRARDPLPERLARIYEALCDVIRLYQPDVVAVEDIFHAHNTKSALKLGQVRGVALLAAAANGLAVAEYSPLSVKSAVVGYGKAEKEQVQQMVARLLTLESLPQPNDVADALAVAICHLNTAGTLARQAAR